MKPRVDGIMRYVRHQDAAAFMARGWMFLRDLGPTHGEYSALWWHCDCGAVEP